MAEKPETGEQRRFVSVKEDNCGQRLENSKSSAEGLVDPGVERGWYVMSRD
jgi:hypothetical protein